MHLLTLDVPGGPGCTCRLWTHLLTLDAPADTGCTCGPWMLLPALDAPAGPGRTRGPWTHLLTLDAPAGPGLLSALDAPAGLDSPAAPAPPLPSFHLAERGHAPAPPGENGVVPLMGVLGAVRAFVSECKCALRCVSPWSHLEGTLDGVRAAEDTSLVISGVFYYVDLRSYRPSS
ncbi:interleukin-15 isoform X1 [Vulpes lagopus]|uniref:interleukin-15 isoform X1 n=1 Tax=Vulpes lagopus TaxID=494514 RepID=UPI001BC956CF|nr:interleukin-15 isoform X1 [Vulpes lagopus]